MKGMTQMNKIYVCADCGNRISVAEFNEDGKGIVKVSICPCTRIREHSVQSIDPMNVTMDDLVSLIKPMTATVELMQGTDSMLSKRITKVSADTKHQATFEYVEAGFEKVHLRIDKVVKSMHEIQNKLDHFRGGM